MTRAQPADCAERSVAALSVRVCLAAAKTLITQYNHRYMPVCNKQLRVRLCNVRVTLDSGVVYTAANASSTLKLLTIASNKY
jgi:hypothetical protein